MAKGNFIEYVVSDNPNKYPNNGELNGCYYETVEDVVPEVTAQTPVITQIAENLGVTITTPSGTNKQILQGNNANLLNIKNNAKKEGAYVWKKLTAQGGDFVDFVVSDSPTSYPDGGEQGGYWYKKVVEGTTFGLEKFAHGSFMFGTNQESDFTLEHNLGARPKFLVIYTDDDLKNLKYAIRSLQAVDRYRYGTSSPNLDCFYVNAIKQSSTSTSYEGFTDSSLTAINEEQVNDSMIILHCDSICYFCAGKTYYWAAFA